MAESLDLTEPAHDPDPRLLRHVGSDKIRCDADTAPSRLRLALLEHERNLLTQRVDELSSRVQTLETKLANHRDRRQQIVDHYERIIAEKDHA